MYNNLFYDTGLKGIYKRTIHDGIYMIFNCKNFEEVLTITKSENSRSYLHFSKITNAAYQFFFIKYIKENDCYTIKNLESQLFLGVVKKEDSNYNNSLVVLNSNTQTHLNNWNIDFDDGFSFQLEGYDYNLQYIEEANFIQISDKNDSENQKFFITPINLIKTGLYYISSLSPKNYYISFSRNEDIKNPYLNHLTSSDDQFFYIIYDENDGCYSIINNYNDNYTCLSLDQNSELVQTVYYNLDSQKWIIGINDSGKCFICNKSNGLLLCNSVAKNGFDGKICLKTFDSKLQYNCHFQFEKENIPFWKKKLQNWLGYGNKILESSIKQINKRLNLPYYQIIAQEAINRKIYINSFILKNLKITQEVINRELYQNNFMLKYLEIPLSVTHIDTKALSNCFNIKFINCHPNWLKLLPNAINIENIVIPNGISEIVDDVFQKFTNLKYLSLPQTLDLKKCKKNLFNNIYGLKTFKGDPKFLKIIHKNELMTIDIPTWVKKIPESICAGCESLKEVHIEMENSSLEVIKPKAFAGCKLLRFVSIPESVKNIAPDAFLGCNEYFELKLSNQVQEKSMFDKLIIQPNVKKITIADYSDYINIIDIEIPIEVQDCEQPILKRFKNLSKVKCDPKWLNSFNTEKIKSISIPEQITELKKRDFDNLKHLKFIEIPESVKKIEKNTFKNCNELTDVKCGTRHLKFLKEEKIKFICLNEQVTNINADDFNRFINLEKCKISPNTQGISREAFINCKKLIDIDHPNGKNSLNNTFSINEGTTKIDKKDFQGWTNLKSLVLPSSIIEIEKDAFKDCVNLKYLTCDPKWFRFIPKNSIRKIVIPIFVKELNKGQFNGFNLLTYIKLPKEIKINDPAIFESCENLKIIRCESSIFNKLTEKTIKQCDSKLKIRYDDPIFNFQPDASKIDDETKSLDSTSYIASNLYISAPFHSSNAQEENRSKTIEDLVACDGFNVNYKKSIRKVIKCIKSKEISKEIDTKSTDILNIANICAIICNKIYKKLKITPNVVQIYAVLRLANEILNENKSIGEIKPGEGKSLIIAILSIILIKLNHTIDIIISNLKIAKQYQYEQSQIFDLFKINTAIFKDKRNETDSDFINEKDLMENLNLEAFGCPVVYSTNLYFEYYYLHINVSNIPRKREFDVVLITGIDNMLNDESYTPVTISKEINYVNSPYILCYVFASRFKKTSNIKFILKDQFQDASDFTDHDIELLKNAALEAFDKEINVDYILLNNQIVIIDHDSGKKKPYSHWPLYVLQMVEIKEGILPRPVSLSLWQITHQNYYKLYPKMAGITETLGSESDEKVLKQYYDANAFRVPRDKPFDVYISYKYRPDKIDDIFKKVNEEITNELIQNERPVLVIWDSKYNADKFLQSIKLKNVGCIFGVNKRSDENAIKNAGKLKHLTITTSNAIKDVYIILENEAILVGGLHIIIPMKIHNIRSLEQHVTMAGRQGQNGSVTIFKSNDDLYITTSFDQGNVNLDKLQSIFVNDIKKHIPWILCGPNIYNFGNESILPFAANYSDIFNILSRQMYLIINEITASNEKETFKDLSWLIVQTAWSSFFTSIQNEKSDNKIWMSCNREYIRFITELNNFFSFEESQNVDSALNFILEKFSDDRNNEHMIYKGFVISQSSVKLIPQQNISLDSSHNQEDENIIISYAKKIIKKVIWASDIYIENKNRIPSRNLLAKTPELEIENLNIDFIRMTIYLAKEAYDGKFSIGRVIFASEVNAVFMPKFYCIEFLNMLFVVTRGSKSDVDWITDFQCEERSEIINGTQIYFHSGFLTAAHYILSNIAEILERNYEKIYYVGHSYAAAVSNVLCVLTKTHPNYKENNNIFSFAFAPPPAMSKVPAYIQDCMFTFINKSDIVPHLSLNNIKNTVNLDGTSLKVFFESKINYLKTFDIEYAKKLVEYIEKYKDYIYSIFDSVKNEFHVNKNIGNIFYIGLCQSNKLRKYQVDESKLENKLFFVPTMLSDHSINQYIESFEIIKEY